MLKFYFYKTFFEKDPYRFYEEDDLNDELPKKITFPVPLIAAVTKLSFLLLKNNADGYEYIGKIYWKYRGGTFVNMLVVRDLRRLHGVDLEKLVIETHGQEKAEKIIESSHPIRLREGSADKVKERLLETNKGLSEAYFSFDRLIGGNYSDILPQASDSIATAFSIFGFDIRDIPPLREHQILDFDVDSFFSQPPEITPDGRKYFINHGKRLYVQKVHNTKIELCLGVDLIYNFYEDKRIIFVQYKCVNDDDKFYKSSDKHFSEELRKMKEIPRIKDCPNFKAGTREELRICNCPVYIKLCDREIKGKRQMPYGFYYPICIWDYIYALDKEKFITLNDNPRINNEHFVDLVKSGLLGSVPSQSEEINLHLVTKSNDNRLKLIFTETRVDSAPLQI